jgi:hypothetical protein
MAKEVIAINEPEEMGKDFEEGTLLQIEGKVFKVKEDSLHNSGCNECSFCDDIQLKEYCSFANCMGYGIDDPGCHFVEIESHE